VCRLTSGRGRSLDVGSGDGAFSLHLHRRGFSPTMTDLDPRSELVKDRIEGSRFYPCLFEDMTDMGPYDVIIMSHVLEHSLDPIAWLRRAEQILSPGGVLAVAVPNFGGVYRLLGTKDPFINPPQHLNYFTAKSLSLAMRAAKLTPKVSSISLVNASHPSLAKRAIAHTWNLGAVILDTTTRGIALTAYGVKSMAVVPAARAPIAAPDAVMVEQ
jgi:SAM-dependent methyltransferase